MNVRAQLLTARLRLRKATLPIRYRSRTTTEITNRFHRLYFDAHLQGKTWADTHWFGVPVAKCPLDLWIYQEIVAETRPDLVLETGTFEGGSALFFASLFDLVGNGRVVTVDVEERGRPEHDRVTYLTGSSIAPEIVEQMAAHTASAGNVLVVLDSDHSREHVLAELRAYGGFVTPGSYLIVEDTNVNGHPVAPEFGPGPTEALEQFLEEDDRFVVDDSKEKFLLSFNPGGYLRRIATT
jgi:cephalosporin hydroxylase